MFDTLKFARALRDGGQFTPEQAERLSDALSEAISGEVVSRADLGATEAELGKKIDASRAELVAAEGRLDRKIDALQAELVAAEGRLDRKIDALQAELVAAETRLDRKVDALRAELKQETAELRAELKQEIAELRAELKGDIKGIETKIEAAKSDTIKWVVGIISFQSVAIIGAVIVLARILAR